MLTCPNSRSFLWSLLWLDPDPDRRVIKLVARAAAPDTGSCKQKRRRSKGAAEFREETSKTTRRRAAPSD